MKALLWKDYRQNRPFLAAAGILLLFPYAFVVVLGVVELLADDHSSEVGWAQYFAGASIGSLFISVMLSAFVAGNSVAGERADRSAEFTAILPISRRSSIISKALLAATACVFMWLANGLVLYLTTFAKGVGRTPVTDDFVPALAATTVFTFGVSWLVSTLVSRPATAALSGLGCVAILWTGLLILEETWNIDADIFPVLYPLLCLLLGTGCFVAGVVCYLWRVEP